jgi:hypothetical protein
MSDPKKSSVIGEIFTRGVFPFDPLLRMLLGKQSVDPPYPTTSLPNSQIKHLGGLYRDMQMNNPENMAEIQYEVDDPSGRLGRMLTPDERRMLMKLITRRITE